MKELIIEKKYNSPYIHFNPESGKLIIQGKSVLEDPNPFYKKLYEWLHEYFATSPPKTILQLKLDYINSSSAKHVRELLNLVEKNFLEGRPCEIEWYYEQDDESIYELGENFKTYLDMPFKFVEF
jgi:hypothetical protein